MRVFFRCLVVSLASLLLANVAAASPDDAARAFEKLSALVGQWEGTFENGRRHTVSYRLSAGGSVLVETWALAPGRESLTLYHRDGEDLVAVHYCPQGTQPRLRLAKTGKDGRLDFAFDGGSNVQQPGLAHQHAMWIRIDDANSFQRSETYVDNGTPAAEADAAEAGAAVRYTRIAGADASP